MSRESDSAQISRRTRRPTSIGEHRHDDHPTTSPESRFGAELRRLRLLAELTHRGLGDRIGVSHSSISEWETGKRLPSLASVMNIENLLGLEPGTLLELRRRALEERIANPKDGTLGGPRSGGACPYMGLRAFEREDAELFFGREAEVEQVAEQLARVRFAALIGASGSGKSSFVRAGLLAAPRVVHARGGAEPRVALLTPGAQPLAALARAVCAVAGGDPDELCAHLRVDPRRLLAATHRAPGSSFVLVVDQLEELFTLCPDAAERRAFVTATIGAWREPMSPITLVVALRADFYGEIAIYDELAAAAAAYHTLLAPMSRDNLRRAIELPAAQADLLVQSGLADTIIEDLADEAGALPLLSHALAETWERRQGRTLTIGGYRAGGGVRGAIAQRAELALQELPVTDQAIVRSIFLRLTELTAAGEPARRRLSRDALPAGGESAAAFRRVLGVLADARLVTVDEHTVVVAHESLVRNWPRLREWIDADRAGLLVHRRLIAAAQEWTSLDHDSDSLYRGLRLAAAREWATDHRNDLAPLERDFLRAGDTRERLELHDARRRGRRLRVLAFGMAVLAAVVAVLAIWALDRRDAARSDAREVAALALVAASTQARERPEVALILAFEAYRASARPEARASVIQALGAVRGAPGGAFIHARADGGVSVAFAPDGESFAAASADHAIRVWRTNGDEIRPALVGHVGAVTSIAFSLDGETIASAGADGTIRLWSVRTHQQLGAPMPNPARDVRGLVFLPDGRTLAAAGADGTVRLGDVQTHRMGGRPLSVSDFVATYAGRLATLASDMSLPFQAPERGAGRPAGGAATLAPDLATIATSDAGGTIHLRDPRTLEQAGEPFAGHVGSVSALAFSNDGRTLASAGADGTVRLWDLASRKQLGPSLPGHRSGRSSVRFTRDGRTLASTGDDGNIRLWERILWRNLVELRSDVCALAGRSLTRGEWSRYVGGAAYRRTCP